MPYKLSPSTLNLYNECHRCFWLHIKKKIRRPNGPFPSLPSGIDKLLKGYFEKYYQNEELPPELLHLNGRTKPFTDINLLRKWQNNFNGISWKDSKGNVLHGAVDSMLKDGSKLVVLDFKTRGYELKEDTADHYQNQLDVYNFLLNKNGYKTAEYSYLLFFIPSSIRSNGLFKFQTELVKRKVNPASAQKNFNAAIKLLDGKEPRVTATCGFCGWKG